MPRVSQKKSKGKGEGSSEEHSHGQPTDWSDWITDLDVREGWYRWRTGVSGQTEYDYSSSNNNEPRSTPYYEEDLTRKLASTKIAADAGPQTTTTGESSYVYGTPASGGYGSSNTTSGTYPAYNPPYQNYHSSTYMHGSQPQGGTGSYNSNWTTNKAQVPDWYASGSASTGPLSYQMAGPSYQQDSYTTTGGSIQQPTTQNGGRIKPAADTKPLDPSFGIHRSKSFKPGRVFKVLWSEPMGQSTSGMTEVTQDEAENTHGQSVYTTIRRFVIVANDKGHCQCVPILTYGRQGLTKPGVKSDEHAIIYTESAQTVNGEGAIGKTAIHMISNSPQEKLNNASRVNYAKIYTVEHNVRVKFIGRIADESMRQFASDFDNQWVNKMRFDY